MYQDRLSEEQYRALQDRLLKRFIAEEIYPFHPYYRSLFESHGLLPKYVQSVTDLARHSELFTKKSDISPDPVRFILQPTPSSILFAPPRTRAISLLARELAYFAAALPNVLLDNSLNKFPWAIYRLGWLHLPQPKRAKEILEERYVPVFPIGTTGRSTGMPTLFLFTDADLERLKKLGQRFFQFLGMSYLKPGERKVLDLFPVAIHLADLFLRQTSIGAGALVFPTGGGKGIGTQRSVTLSERIQAKLIGGVPDYVEKFLRDAYDAHKDLSSVELVVTGGDALAPKRRRVISDLLSACGSKNPAVIASYGFTEARAAFTECPEGARDGGTGYHVFPDIGAVELINNEVVWTDLAGFGTVVLRYRTGDYAAGLTWDPCPACKRTIPRILPPIFRKSSDMEKNIRGTRVDFNDIFPIFEDNPDILEWQLVLSSVEDRDKIEIYLAVKEESDIEVIKTGILRNFREAADNLSLDAIHFETLESLVNRLGIDTELKSKRVTDSRTSENPAR